MNDKLTNFLVVMKGQGHSDPVLELIRAVYGQEMSVGMFIVKFKEAKKTGASPSKARNLFRYLVEHSIIRSNER